MNDFANRVFHIIQDANQQVITDEIDGNDDIFSILVPYGRGKHAQEIDVGEETLVITKKRDLYKDKRGLTKPFVYRLCRVS
jgi:hypothetical protein